VRQGFLALAKKEPKRIVVLDTNKSVESVSQKIRERLERVFGK
jgi:thymidylate kinase